MKKKPVLGIMLTLLLLSMAGSTLNISQSQTASGTMAEENPIPSFVLENKLVYESAATYQWLDPHVSYYLYDYWILWHSVEMLLWYERDNPTKIIPWLAESYEISDDRLHCNFTLRQGISFQDGTPFNATAVWFSLNRLLIIDGTSATGVHGSQAAWMVQQLVDPYGFLFSAMGASPSYDSSWVEEVLDLNFVEIIDEYKVRINIMTPTTQFFPVFAGPWAAIISPISTIQMDYEHGEWGTWNGNYNTYFEHVAGNGDTALNLPENGWRIGTGAYYVESVEWTTSYRIVLKAYDDYWGGPNNIGLPPADKQRIEIIEYKRVPNFAARLLDLEAGTATAIQVPATNMSQVVDGDKWIDEGELISIIDGVTVYGVFPTFNTWWLCFNTNITNPDETFKSWQPFSDWRLRMAVSCSVDLEFMNIHVNNRLGTLADNIIPPGTFPEGSHNPNVKPIFSHNLTKAEELLLAANASPLTTFTFYNGSAIPAGNVDNSFGSDFAHPKTVEFYVQEGAYPFIETLTAMSDNLNAIAEINDLGIRFDVVIVPGGQQYMLASQHLIDSYMGGWIADYNHLLNWLQPMYRSTGTYFSWNLWNITRLDDLCEEAMSTDQIGDLVGLLEANDEMNTIANEALVYMVWWHNTQFFTRSSLLKGWYFNPVHSVDIWSSMYYETPPGVSANLARRGAWPEHRRFVLSRDGDLFVYDKHGTPGVQTLYSIVKNTGNATLPSGTYKALWNISDSTGSSRTVEKAGLTDLAPGEIMVLTINILPEDLPPDRYYIEAKCHYYMVEGEKAKTFSFTVVP